MSAAIRLLWTASLIALSTPACGYRPLNAALPGGMRSVRVALPDPARTDEPGLSRLLATELCRELSRAGIPAWIAGGRKSDGELRTKILSLDAASPVLGRGARAVAAETLTLRLELKLVDEAGNAVWRSGLVEVNSPWPLGDGTSPPEAEAARQRTLAGLATAAARRVAMLLALAD